MRNFKTRYVFSLFFFFLEVETKGSSDLLRRTVNTYIYTRNVECFLNNYPLHRPPSTRSRIFDATRVLQTEFHTVLQ